MPRNVLRPFIFVLIQLSFPALLLTAQRPPAVGNLHADRILVVKSTHTMTLYAHGSVLRTYHVALGIGPGNAKQRQGDRETPEGRYIISGRNPHSSCHLSLRISYPNADDRARARKLGIDPGGDIMIHGLPPGYDYIPAGAQIADWTWGCIGLTNPEMDEVWKLVPDGTPIEIEH